MTINQLESMIRFSILENESEQAVKDIISKVKEYAEPLKTKADKWDALGEKIAECYVYENGDELSEEESEDVDLGTIGEKAAIAYGWL